jgi:hypothetical protein
MIYDLKHVKQLKLSTGEEIMCEILEEDEFDLIIRNPLTIQFAQTEDGQRMWSFRLFMCYQDDPDRFILLKLDKIVSIANPVDEIMKQYIQAVDSIMDYDGTEPTYEDEFVSMDSDSPNNILKFPTTIH